MRFGRPHLRLLGALSALVFAASFVALRVTGDGTRDALGNPLFPDLAQFHVAGRLVLEGELARVYDGERFWREVTHVLGTTDRGSFIFVYPPFVAWWSAPLALVSFPVAAWLVFAANLALAAFLARDVARRLGAGVERELALLFFGSLPVWRCLLFGQNGLFSLAVAWAAYRLFLADRRALAGAVLALGCYKPQVFFGLGAYLALAGGPRAWAGFAAVAGALAGVTTLWGGAALWPAWLGSIGALEGVPGEGIAMRVALRDAFVLVGAPRALELAAWAAGLALWAWGLLRHRADRDRALALALGGSLLLAPRLFQYDLVLLYPIYAGFFGRPDRDRVTAALLGALAGALYLGDAFATARVPVPALLGLALLVRAASRPPAR